MAAGVEGDYVADERTSFAALWNSTGGDWIRINGFSEAVISYIRELEESGLDA